MVVHAHNPSPGDSGGQPDTRDLLASQSDRNSELQVQEEILKG